MHVLRNGYASFCLIGKTNSDITVCYTITTGYAQTAARQMSRTRADSWRQQFMIAM